MLIKQMYIDANHPNRPGTKMSKVTGVVAHWTANESKGADAQANRNYFNRKYKTISGEDYEADGKDFRHASAHLNVDDRELVECLPWKKGEAEVGYHVGGTYKPGITTKLGTTYPNNRTIGLEICVNSDANFAETYANAIVVTAMMLKEHDLTTNDLYRHFDITGKLCPGFHTQATYSKKYLGTNDFEQAWKDFKSAVAKAMSGATLQPTSSYIPMKDKNDSNVLHERIYMSGSNLSYVRPDATGAYKIKGTDVRLLKLAKGKYTMKMVWEKNAKVSDLVKKYGADYGFNFPFFYSGAPIADCKIGTKILQQGYDKVGGAQMTKWHGFKYANGQASIGQFPISSDLGAEGFLVKTTPLLLNGKGEEAWDYYRNLEGTAKDIGRDANGNLVSAQRTFVGIDANGDLLLGIADGRGTYDKGLTLQEMAKYMKDKGALWALNGDGGGSTILANKSGGLNQSANTGANERIVNHVILVFLNKEVVTPPPVPPVVPPVTTQYWRVFMDEVQKGAFSAGVNAEALAKQLYRETKNQTIQARNPNGSAYYTPSKHPEDFPEMIVDSYDELTQKAILAYLKSKFV